MSASGSSRLSPKPPGGPAPGPGGRRTNSGGSGTSASRDGSSPRSRERGAAQGRATNSGVRVSARFRPPNALEQTSGGKNCITVAENGKSVALFSPKDRAEFGEWAFDKVFTETSKQEDVYEFVAKPLVEELLQGYNCTILAYGQTGSGKTHTMMGETKSEEMAGVIPRIIDDIFAEVKARRAKEGSNLEITVRAAYMELYLEAIHDLLNPSSNHLRIREEPGRGTYVEGILEVGTEDKNEMLELMSFGSQNRAVAATKMNSDSSRSHSIFLIMVEQREVDTGTKKTGQMYLVDLAGSEMVGKTGAAGTQLAEAKMINKSLSALGLVIKALVEGSGHIPYRDSKLTRVLQHSLGGNSQTSLLVACSGSSYNLPETASTLRFGARARKIKNKPKVNQERSIGEYKKLLDKSEVREARLQLLIQNLEVQMNELRLSVHAGTAGAEAPQALAGIAAHPEQARAALDAKEQQVKLLELERDRGAMLLSEKDMMLADREEQCRQLRTTVGKLFGLVLRAALQQRSADGNAGADDLEELLQDALQQTSGE